MELIGDLLCMSFFFFLVVLIYTIFWFIFRIWGL